MSTENQEANLNVEGSVIEVVPEIVEPKRRKKAAEKAEVTEADANAAAVAAVEIPKPNATKPTIEVETREGYRIVGRKPTFGDRRYQFAQPEGLNIPASELLPAACIVSVEKQKLDEKGEPVRNEKDEIVYEPVQLDPNVFPWFHLESLGIEGPFIYMNLWNQTYMPTQEDMAFGYLHAMRSMNQGNA